MSKWLTLGSLIHLLNIIDYFILYYIAYSCCLTIFSKTESLHKEKHSNGEDKKINAKQAQNIDGRSTKKALTGLGPPGNFTEKVMSGLKNKLVVAR